MEQPLKGDFQYYLDHHQSELAPSGSDKRILSRRAGRRWGEGIEMCGDILKHICDIWNLTLQTR